MRHLSTNKWSAFTHQMRYVRQILSFGLPESTSHTNAQKNEINGVVGVRVPSKTCFSLINDIPTQILWLYRQCSECDKESSSSDTENVDTDAPRKLRRCSRDRDSKNEVWFPQIWTENTATVCQSFLFLQDFIENDQLFEVSDFVEPKKNKKRRRDKHRNRYSPEVSPQTVAVKHHSRKRKHKSPNRSLEPEPPRQGIKLFVSSVFRIKYMREQSKINLLNKSKKYSPKCSFKIFEIFPKFLKFLWNFYLECRLPVLLESPEILPKIRLNFIHNSFRSLEISWNFYNNFTSFNLAFI